MIRPKMMMTMVPSRSGTSKTFFYSRSAHSVFEIREKEYEQTRVKCLRKGVQTHSMGGASNSARAMDNFTNEATTGCLSKNDEDFLLFSFERFLFRQKKCAFRLDFYIYTTSSTITLL